MALSPETIIALIGLFIALPPALIIVSRMRSCRGTPGTRQSMLNPGSLPDSSSPLLSQNFYPVLDPVHLRHTH
jgi:hypothetical protein